MPPKAKDVKEPQPVKTKPKKGGRANVMQIM